MQVRQIHLRVHFYFQPVDVMLLDQVVYNVRTQLVHVPAMADTRIPNVIQHVAVIPLVQAAQHVISLQVNVLVILDTQEPHATLVTLTTIELVMEHAQVVPFYSNTALQFKYEINFLACGCDATGSRNLQCVDSTGQCTCNAGYKGLKCDIGCGCDTTGSRSTACDQLTGQCTCNNAYTGTTCNSCDTNYYQAGDGVTCAGLYT